MIEVEMVLLLLAIWFGVMGLVDQKVLWWRFPARRFGVSEADEASGAGYEDRRILLTHSLTA
ncbi:hypothetical protein [Streptomyces sp. NPDC007929]|uniref:hypothetical protein n=1 Tax=unclassified Streptomyces TaxID=2593676 RepID=UPI0036E51768